MKRAVLLGFVLLGLSSSVASPEEPSRLPWNPFEGARAGDRCSYVATLRAEGDASISSERVTWTIARVTSDEVTLEQGGRERTLSADRAPTLAEFLELREGELPSAVTVTTEDRAVAGKTYACTRVSFALGDAMGRREDVSVWLSRAVPAMRIVAMTWRRSPRAGTFETLTLELDAEGSAAASDRR